MTALGVLALLAMPSRSFPAAAPVVEAKTRAPKPVEVPRKWAK
jgi:hypothetical protein